MCLVVEYCGVSYRTVPLMMVMVSYTVASLTVPWLAMALSSWRVLALTSCLAILPVLACYRCNSVKHRLHIWIIWDN